MWPPVFDPFRKLKNIERRLGTVLNTTNQATTKIETWTPMLNEKLMKKVIILK